MASGASITLSFSPAGPNFAISEQAVMPRITATAAVSGLGAGSAPLQFHWRVTLRSNRRGCLYARPQPSAHPDIVLTTTTNQLAIPFTKVRGGDLSVHVSITTGGRAIAAVRDDLKIVGTNPTIASLSVAAAGATPAFRKLMRHESALRQFRQPTCPLWSADSLGGVGLCQLTPPQNDDQIWNWKENLRGGLAVYAEKERAARGYPARVRGRRDFMAMVDEYNEARKRASLPVVSVTIPDFTADQLQKDTIRLYNGGHEFRPKVMNNLLVVTLDASGRAGSAEWEPIPVSQRTVGDPDYVNNVLRQADF